MKVTSIKSLFTLLAVALLFTSAVQAQEKKQEFPKDLFVEIACFEALKPGAVKMFTEMGKPFHEEMIRMGILVDWSFHRVDYPNGDDCECDYREVRVFRGMAALDKLNSNELGMKIAAKLWPDMDMQATMKDFRETVKFKNSRIYHAMDAAAPNPVDAKMAVMNFMDAKPGKFEDCIAMEMEVFKPVHMVSMKTGKMKDWVIMESVLPYGTDFKTDYITVDIFDSYSDMSSNDMMASFKKAHPGKDPMTVLNKMGDMRDLTHSEILVKITEADVKQPALPEATSAKDK
jgi:hypothetical protein